MGVLKFLSLQVQFEYLNSLLNRGLGAGLSSMFFQFLFCNA